MPWQERSIMEERQEFVRLAQHEAMPISQLCRRFGISRKTGYKWLARYAAEGAAGLGDRSRRPHHAPHRTPPAVEAQVLAAHDRQPRWGPRKLAAWLVRHGHPQLAPSTVAAILARHNRQVAPPPLAHRPWQRFEQPASNDLWQIDFKGGLALEQGWVYPLSVLDDHSRFALGLIACPNQQQPTVWHQLTQLFQRYGLPRCILTDNGPPWGPSGQGGITALEAWWIRLGIRVSHGRHYHPQTQGKVERFQGTLAAEVLLGPPFVDRAACQAACDRWRTVYNLDRPHQALDHHVPLDFYTPSPRPLPAALPPIAYGPDDAVRMVKQHGVIDFGNRRYFIGRGLAGLPVAVRPTRTDGQFTVHFCAQQVGTLDLRSAGADLVV